MNIVNLQIDAPMFHKKNPLNWKELSINGAYRLRKLFEEEDVYVILSADETFLRFYECTKKVLTPIGVNVLELHFP